MKLKKANGYYLFAAIISLVFLLFGTGFVYYMMKKNRDQSIQFLYRAAEQESVTVGNQIKSNWETLDGIAACLSNMGAISRPELLRILTDINKNNTFICMGLTDQDGLVDLVDIDGTVYEQTDLSGEVFFAESMNGAKSISDIQIETIKGRSVNYYGVPVRQNGEITGVLCGVNSVDNLRNVLDAPIFNAGGFSSIINSDGACVVSAPHLSALTHISELGTFEEGRYEQILEDLAAGREGFAEYQYNGAQQWAVYNPLGINDWYILSLVPERVVNDHYSMVLGVILIVSIAFVIIFWFIFRINRLMDRSRKQLEQLAYNDSLTGVSNFAGFKKDAQTLVEAGYDRPYAFWYCDIDNFKFFNDLFGYEAGDRALKFLSELIGSSLKPEELYCRVDADTFAGIRYYRRQEEMIAWFQSLYQEMEHYKPSGKQIYQLRLSMGIYCVEKPGDVLSVNDMQNRANMAQKHIKTHGNVKYAFYTDDIRKSILIRNNMESHMQQALEHEEFEVYIQPKVDIQNHNRIRGGEALVRWNRPGEGMVSPGEFIPLFERNGFIIKLDRYVFYRVCTWLKGYLDQGNRPLRLAVNVSRLGLFQEDFLSYYIGTKNHFQIPDGILELEFTEGIALDDHELFRNMVIELQTHGFVCSMDDFGAGYSSLNILKELPIQVLKLDMLFFRKDAEIKRSRIVITNIIRMAKELNMATVSEGVEHWEQVEFLKRTGCDVVQGYVFAKPMPIPEFEKLVASLPDGFPDQESEIPRL